MKTLLKTGICAYLLSGITLANAAEVPLTELTKGCKSLVNKNLKIEEPPIKGLDERTYKRLVKAQEYMANNEYSEGIEVLKGMLESARSDYIKATVNIQLAYAYAQQNKQDESFPYFIEALKYGANTLPTEKVQSLRLNVGGFMFMNGNKAEGIKLIEEWMSKSNADSAYAYYLLAAMYADEEIGRNVEAVCPAYFATKTEEKPKKSYYQMLLSLHWNLKDIPGAAKVLTTMVEQFPENLTFWRQLSSVHMELNQYKESLAIMEMLHLQGRLETETDYKSLSSLFSYEDVPYRAAKILEEGLNKGIVTADKKNWKTVAQSYQLSNDLQGAIKAYGETAKFSSDGDAYLKQAQLYSDLKQYKSAITAYDKAIEKGGLDDVGRAYLDKGVTLIDMGRCDSALTALDQASKYQDQRQSAVGWTAYAKDRKKREKC